MIIMMIDSMGWPLCQVYLSLVYQRFGERVVLSSMASHQPSTDLFSPYQSCSAIYMNAPLPSHSSWIPLHCPPKWTSQSMRTPSMTMPLRRGSTTTTSSKELPRRLQLKMTMRRMRSCMTQCTTPWNNRALLLCSIRNTIVPGMLKQGFGSWQISSSEWKKDWEHQCALISQNMLSKTNTLNFYMKKTLNIFFLDDNLGFRRFFNQIWLPKTVFWTNMEGNVFFNPILKYFTIYNFFFFDNMCVFLYKKNQELVAKAFLNTLKLFFGNFL